MKTLINNASTGLMISGAGVFLVCALASMPKDAAEGFAFLVGAAIVKLITSKQGKSLVSS